MMSFDWQTYESVWRWWTKTQLDERDRTMLEPDFEYVYDCPECGQTVAITIFGYVNAHEGPESTDHEVRCDCDDPPVMDLYRIAEEEELYRLKREYESKRVEAAERRLDEMMSSDDDWRIL